MARQKIRQPCFGLCCGGVTFKLGILSEQVGLVRCDGSTQHSTDSTHKPVTCQKSRAIAVVRVVAAISGVPEHIGALPEVGLRVVKAERVGGEGVQPPREASGHTGVRPSW